MSIEEVLGMVITPDGLEHPFGIKKLSHVKDLESENYHDPSFVNEIVSTDWFQAIGYPYDKNESLAKQIFDMTSYGLTFILNGSNKITSGEEVYLYTIQAPENLSEKTKEYLQSHYTEWKNIMDRENTYFQGEAYRNGEYIDDKSVYSLDEFYQCLNIPTKGKTR